ncbi:MAG: AMP-binding protein [Rhodocyclaceae bacterium]|nr:AMP-binding protein [Rhodocyclaceae bacterium]
MSRPWLASYPAGVPAAAEPAQPDALSLFRAAAAAAPSGDAVRYFDHRLDYAELDRLSDALAVALQRRGFRAGDRLAVYLQNMPHFLVATLAAWKAGGIVVTINPMNREYELGKLLADAEPRALVCLEGLREGVVSRLAPETLPPILLTVDARDMQGRNDPRIFPAGAGEAATVPETDLRLAIAAGGGERPPAHRPAPAEVAFIVYTSGTTGLPKGARITHANLVQVAAAHKAWYGLAPGTPVLAAAPLFHITGLAGHMILAWALAAPLVLCHRFDPGVVLEAIAEHRPRYTANAITAYIALVNQPGVDPAPLASLEIVTSGGAPVPPSVARQVREKLGWPVLNGYGLTETSSGVVIMPVGSEGRVDPVSGALSIGVPICGVDAWIEGEGGVRLGHDEIGEIVLGGPMVADGYWRKPAETAESMRPDGFRTGDVGFMDAGGWFYVVDRKKDMINASGYKVWPREVEDVLYAHPAVREAAVVGVGDEYRGETVKAVVSLREGCKADRDELVTWCRERLAAYKVPRIVEFVEELPKNATGKVLRRVLRERRAGQAA